MNHNVTLPALVTGLLFSLFAHFLISLTRTSVFSPTVMNEPRDSQPIELTDVPKQWLTPSTRAEKKPVIPIEKQIVETEDAGNRDIDPNAKFLSDRNQTVKKQTRANKVDDFHKKVGEGKEGDSMGKGEQSEKQDERPREQMADGVGDKSKPWKSLSLKDLGLGGDGGKAGATDDWIKGIDEGSQTILSTREFKFFSYYHRIKELLRQYWKPNVERQLARVWGKGKSISGDELITQVLVLLDEQGTLKKISRIGSSGVDEVDDAAVSAFQQAAPFPNPPKGIVDSDGFVRIRWDFILKTDSGPRIQFSTAGVPPPTQ